MTLEALVNERYLPRHPWLLVIPLLFSALHHTGRPAGNYHGGSGGEISFLGLRSVRKPHFHGNVVFQGLTATCGFRIAVAT
jgi:hypothetical protein